MPINSIGNYGSPIHVLTNNKVDSKTQTLKDIAKQNFKTNVGTIAFSAAGGGIAGLVARYSNKLPEKLIANLKNGQGELKSLLSKLKFGEKSVADLIKNSDIFKSVNKLPTAVKAAIGVGALLLTVLAPAAAIHNHSTNAAIEAKHEVK